MKTKILNDWVIYTVQTIKEDIDPKPQYQRTAVWTKKKKTTTY